MSHRAGGVIEGIYLNIPWDEMMLSLSSPESRCCEDGERELIRDTIAAAKDMTNKVRIGCWG